MGKLVFGGFQSKLGGTILLVRLVNFLNRSQTQLKIDSFDHFHSTFASDSQKGF